MNITIDEALDTRTVMVTYKEKGTECMAFSALYYNTKKVKNATEGLLYNINRCSDRYFHTIEAFDIDGQKLMKIVINKKYSEKFVEWANL